MSANEEIQDNASEIEQDFDDPQRQDVAATKIQPPRTFLKVSLILLICVTGVMLVTTVKLIRRHNIAQVSIQQLSQEIDNIVEASKASGLQIFPHTSRMEAAFRKGNFLIATRMAENLVFAYPSDAASFQALLLVYDRAIENSLDEGMLLDASRLVSWMAGIQERQAMVIKSDKAMDLYLSALDRNSSITETVVAKLHTEVASLQESIQAVANDLQYESFESLINDAATLTLAGTLLDQTEMVETSAGFLDVVVILQIPVPETTAPLKEWLEYLEQLYLNFNDDRTDVESILAVLAPRFEKVSRHFSEVIETLLQSQEGKDSLLRHMDELRFVVSMANDESLIDALGQAESALKRDAENAIRSVIRSYKAGTLTEEDFRIAIHNQTRSLERLDPAGVSVMELVNEQQQVQAELYDSSIADKIAAMTNQLKTPDADLDQILAEVALLPQPSTTETMSALIKLSRNVQEAVAERDQLRSALLVRRYNRWALNELNRLMVNMDEAPRSDRKRAGVNAAKILPLINETYLNKGVRDRYAEVHAEAMKGLNEEQKLEVYEHWVTATPRGLEEIHEL